MLFERQKHLLALVEALGGEIGSLDYQKLLLLYCCELAPTPPYEFVPYRYGGFSFTSYADKRRLIERGLLADEERLWQLTAAGQAAARVPPAVRAHLTVFVRRHAALRGDVLVAEAYRRHPYYATRSEMAARVLAGDAATLRAVEAARPGASRPGLCTIGYEGRTLEGYLNRLLQDGVTLLCDVRRNPLSRKYGFSKATLSTACRGVGIHYEHLPELGIASGQRQGLETQADYDRLFDVYKSETLAQQDAFLKKIGSWVADEGQRVALTCFEADARQCHRHCVADALAGLLGAAYSPVDL